MYFFLHSIFICDLNIVCMILYYSGLDSEDLACLIRSNSEPVFGSIAHELLGSDSDSFHVWSQFTQRVLFTLHELALPAWHRLFGVACDMFSRVLFELTLFVQDWWLQVHHCEYRCRLFLRVSQEFLAWSTWSTCGQHDMLHLRCSLSVWCLWVCDRVRLERDTWKRWNGRRRAGDRRDQEGDHRGLEDGSGSSPRSAGGEGVR